MSWFRNQPHTSDVILGEFPLASGSHREPDFGQNNSITVQEAIIKVNAVSMETPFNRPAASRHPGRSTQTGNRRRRNFRSFVSNFMQPGVSNSLTRFAA